MRLAIVLAALVFSLLGQTSAASTRATLRLEDDSTPALLRGLGFQPREHVRVVILAGSTRMIKRVVATRVGRFVVRVSADTSACAGFSVTAIGNMGTRATLKRSPGQCAQPGTSP